MDHKKEIGNRLKYLRERKGLQQKFVAKKLNIHNATLSKMELGLHEPDSVKLRIMAELYETTPEWILYGDNKNGQVLSELELKLLTLFNSLSEEGKAWLIQSVELLKRSGK